MSPWLIIFCYCLFAYGLSNMMVFGSGPFHIFEHIRNIANKINEHFGLMFSCMMCFPANLGWVISLIDILLLPTIAITPFNLIIADTSLWYLIILLDCCFTSGIVWIIHHIELFFENLAEKNTNVEYIEDNDPDMISVEDITLKKK